MARRYNKHFNGNAARTLVVVIALTMFAVNCLPTRHLQTRYPDNWKEFRQAYFRVMTPSEMKMTSSSEDRHRIEFQTVYQSHVYSVSRALTVRPRDKQEAEQVFDAYRSAYLNTSRHKLQAERSITLSDYPGRELTYEHMIGGGQTAERVYLVDGVLYSISADWKGPRNPNVDLFLDSFQLLNP